MNQPIFIRLENSLTAAMQYRNSPRMLRYSFEGVQLIPNSDYPYVQVTNASEGIELEDFTVYVCDMCGDRLFDVTPYFIVTPFQDPETGLPQVYWNIIGVEYDAGYQLIYLEIVQGANSTVYSSPFMLTAENREYVSRWDYRNDESETMLSTGLQLWFGQEDDLEETTTYDTASGGRRVSVTNKLIPYEVWFTSIINYSLFRLIKQMRRNAYVYCDLIKTSPFEAWDSGRLQDAENFNEGELTLCRDYGNVYDPLYVAPIPPDPPVDPPFINLIRVDSLNDKYVSYVFEFGGDMSPSYFQYQFSLDSVNWTDSTGDITSPHEVSVLDNRNIPYKFRIYYPVTDTYSNIVTLAEPSIEITNITSPDTVFIQIGNRYDISYTLLGFNATSNLTFEASVDGVTWNPGVLYYNNSGAQNPRRVQPQSSAVEFKYFRIKYNPLGIISNVFNFEF